MNFAVPLVLVSITVLFHAIHSIKLQLQQTHYVLYAYLIPPKTRVKKI